MNSPYCFYTFETLDPNHPDPERRHFVVCAYCKTAYTAQAWHTLGCCLRCRHEMAHPLMDIPLPPMLKPHTRLALPVLPVHRVWAGEWYERPDAQLLFAVGLLLSCCLLFMALVTWQVWLFGTRYETARQLETRAALAISLAQTDTARPSPTFLPTLIFSPTPSPAPVVSSTPSPIPHSPMPSATPVPTMPASPTSPPLPPSPTAFRYNPKDGAEVVYVPAGEFMMGSSASSDPYFWGAEAPQHRVYLDEYWIYRTEVTNAMYQVCVAQKACPRPEQTYSRSRSSYYGNADFSNYPVIYVSWTHALSYCQWAGASLPTEAQWEKAARGDDGRMFPWGNALPTGGEVNLCDRDCPGFPGDIETQLSDGYSDTSPVGAFPTGSSVYGAVDMAGNVWEWTYDYFSESYYDKSPERNPLGPAEGTRRVIRGGGWINPTSGIRSAARASLKPDNSLDTVGFRCVITSP